MTAFPGVVLSSTIGMLLNETPATSGRSFPMVFQRFFSAIVSLIHAVDPAEAVTPSSTDPGS
jgi:hypothetical protein